LGTTRSQIGIQSPGGIIMSKSKKSSPARAASSGVHAIYTIEKVERITRISRERIVLYYQHGLVSPVRATKREILFDEEAIHKLRQITFLLSEYGINHQGLRQFVSLMDEVEQLREEVRFLRQKL
jgi:DNA-binding transcriptional MerR regulator